MFCASRWYIESHIWSTLVLLGGRPSAKTERTVVLAFFQYLVCLKCLIYFLLLLYLTKVPHFRWPSPYVLRRVFDELIKLHARCTAVLYESDGMSGTPRRSASSPMLAFRVPMLELNLFLGFRTRFPQRVLST